MTELYLRLLERVLTPVLLMLAIYFLMRGHDLPGGGFIAALMAATAFQLQIMSRGSDMVRREIGPFLQPALGFGLLLAIGTAVFDVWFGGFFDAVWGPEFYLGTLLIKLSTPLIFDIGVFMTVLGFSASYLIGLSEAAPEFFEPDELDGDLPDGGSQ